MELKKISDYEWEINKEGKMNSSAKIFANDKILQAIKNDKTLEQLKNMASLPGLVGNACALPDAHQGYGFCIGGVAALSIKEGGISPGGVGFDINCGVRVLKTNLIAKDFLPKIKNILGNIYNAVPSGLGNKGLQRFENDEFFEMLNKGIDYLKIKGLAKKNDLLNCEDYGVMKKASHEFISPKALARGKNTVGSLGSGNHFIDLMRVDEVFDEKTSKQNGLFKGQVVVMIHSGSRGLGHQVASDYINAIMRKYPEIIKSLPDPEICYAPAGSKMSEEYYASMCACANYAYANRQLMMNSIKEELCKFFKSTEESLGLELFQDITHNVARIESIKGVSCYVHRKGATKCVKNGKIIIPGSMGTSSYLLLGDNAEKSINSSAHGSGRILSRSRAIKTLDSKEVLDSLSKKGIMVKSSSKNIVSEEAPAAYKDIDDVIEVTENSGFAKRIAKLNPFAVING
ncbi:MAG: RtcB family protein [Candidatus Nanoarchaeia archaeon]|nr:RtcB family protein [Candidatus Nanoarchaeia archaeon]